MNVNGSTLLVATDGRPGRGGTGTPGSLFAVNLATREITQATTQSIGTPDGLELDGRGRWHATGHPNAGGPLDTPKGLSRRSARSAERQPRENEQDCCEPS